MEIASFVQGNIKRKVFDDVYDDFSELSLSAPAAKIRRLDAELPSIMEEREPVGGSVIEHQLFKGYMSNEVPDVASVMKEVLPPIVNEERSLVLYKPVHPYFGPSFKTDPKLISGLKNPAFWLGNQNLAEEDYIEEQPSSSINCLAVIPWVPSQFPAPGLEVSTSGDGMEEEEIEAGGDGESMEIEAVSGQFTDSVVGVENVRQWQQNYMFPELSQIASTPILGSW